eukprot:tig00000808_g4415.t1
MAQPSFAGQPTPRAMTDDDHHHDASKSFWTQYGSGRFAVCADEVILESAKGFGLAFTFAGVCERLFGKKFPTFARLSPTLRFYSVLAVGMVGFSYWGETAMQECAIRRQYEEQALRKKAKEAAALAASAAK